MLTQLRSNWHVMRVLRLGLGVLAMVEYFSIHDPLFLMIGGIFLVQGIFNTGCCGAGACDISPKGKKH